MMNLSEYLRRAAARRPDKVALVEGGGAEQTFAALDAEVDAVAAGLQRLGLEPGDRVAIAMGNSLRFVHSYFGILRAGGVAVPLNVMLTPTEIARIVSDAEPRFVLAAPPFSAAVEAAASSAAEAPKVISTETWDELVADAGAPSDPGTRPDGLAVLAYTSGTTGEPKGAMLTHGNLIASLEQQMALPEDHVREDDVILLVLPLFHIFGLNVPLGLLVATGASGVLLERFEPLDALRAIERHKVTVLFGAPTMYAAWVDTPGADQYDLTSVRLGISGAAALSEDVLRSFYALFGVHIYEGYGMTETAPTLTTNRMGEAPRPRSIGKPLPGVEVRLVDENFRDVEPGDPGEIVARGPNIFKGYWRREDENDRYFRDGWFHTGDVAVEDEEGYLSLVDRKRDLVIVSGFNVYPSEVEAALVENEAIAEAAVVGQPHPYTGETVKAFVVLADGASATEDAIIEDVGARLARFKCPTQIEIVESLPRQLTGKVLKRELRA